MSSMNKILTLVTACGMLFALAGQAQAVEETSKRDGVIFRIENIKPITNDKGLIAQCEFYFTVYNRMNKAVKEANIELSWTDNVAGKYRVAGDKLEVEKNAKIAKQVISKSIAIKDIASHQQKSFKEVVDTDRCYLLFDQVEYKVSECIAEGDEIKFKDSKKIGKGSCLNVFDYINSQNPEYYSEFNDVPESELQQMAQQQNEQDTKAVEDMYKNSLDTIKKVSDVLDNMK